MKKASFLLTLIQGSIGKRLVVKHYRYGVVLSSFPDMSGIQASEKQSERRNLFKEAVLFAQSILAYPLKKAAFQQTLAKGTRIYQAAIKAYLKRAAKAPTKSRATSTNSFTKQPGVLCSFWQKKARGKEDIMRAKSPACGLVLDTFHEYSFCKKTVRLALEKANGFP